MTSKPSKQKREGCYCTLEMGQPFGIGVLVTRFERGSKGFVNTQVLRLGVEPAGEHDGKKSEDTGR